MASIKLIFRASAPNWKEGTIYYRIIQNRKVRQIHTGYRITSDEWDSKQAKLIISGTPSRQEYLTAISKKVYENLTRLKRIVDNLERTGNEYTSEDVASQYSAPDVVVGFVSFARKIIDENMQMGQVSASGHYSTSLNSLIRFHGDGEISFDDFDSRLMVSYGQYLKNLDCRPNTVSYYMRKLRAIYNLAVDRGLTEQRNPFKYVYTGVAKTNKRAVPLDVIKTLREMDLSTEPLAAFAKDMFLFSFFTRGMAPVDLAYLKKSDLKNGILTYRRQKTGQELNIHWEDQMQEIVDKYSVPDSRYMLPLIKKDDNTHRRQYQNAAHLINKYLRKLGERIGLSKPLTMYRARHSWASIAQNKHVPLTIISQGLGHDSEKTTRIYLDSLDTSELDKANYTIINLLGD